MKAAMVLGIIMLTTSILIILSSAQEDLPGECWKNIGACRNDVTTQSSDFLKECCPVIVKELNTNTMCFCGAKKILAQNSSLANHVSQLLTICNIGATFDTICPSKCLKLYSILRSNFFPLIIYYTYYLRL